MTLGSLFTGIGGIDLGFERAGFSIAWQVENDLPCRCVLAKHWPDIRRHGDIETFPPPKGSWKVDCIAGGFPCQDVSNAGKQKGIDGERSGLWREFDRIIGVLRPRYVVVENVGSLTIRGLQRVLGDFAGRGYDAEWSHLSAASFGAVHRRTRLFIIAYSAGNRLEGRITTTRELQEPVPSLGDIGDWPVISSPIGCGSINGFPAGVDRIRMLGNAVCPQVAEWIARRIIIKESR